MPSLEEQFTAFTTLFGRLKSEVGRAFVGQPQLVEHVLICLFAHGHALLEGLPGLGKTLLVKTISQALDLKFSRIQCTPDLMPADVIGTNVLNEDGRGIQRFEFQQGPLFGNIVLVDEVNRATPKTQSAFLEAMQERRVTVLGESHRLEDPFLVLATQNPIELEGTYPLPEAQLDRFFFKLKVEYPTLDELSRIVDLTTSGDAPRVSQVADRETLRGMNALVPQVKIAENVKRYALRVAMASHPDGSDAPDRVRQFASYGASPRAAQSLILGAKVRALAEGRYNVSLDDLRALALPALRHRILLNFEAEVAKVSSDDLVADILAQIRPS